MRPPAAFVFFDEAVFDAQLGVAQAEARSASLCGLVIERQDGGDLGVGERAVIDFHTDCAAREIAARALSRGEQIGLEMSVRRGLRIVGGEGWTGKRGRGRKHCRDEHSETAKASHGNIDPAHSFSVMLQRASQSKAAEGGVEAGRGSFCRESAAASRDEFSFVTNSC